MSVLRSGGEFGPRHVQALAKQVKKYLPFHRFECLSDCEIAGVDCVPLRHGWPGWWSKMELFRPDLRGDILFLDIDTVLVGPLDDIAKQTKLTMLRDFYRDGGKRPEGLGSGFMLLTEAARAEPWDYFSKHPTVCVQTYPRGDQHLLEKYYMSRAQRWQDVVPGQVVSWKVHCGGGNVFKQPVIPADARVICFHGQPRPWNVPMFKDLY
jgi:hypothetical protein